MRALYASLLLSLLPPCLSASAQDRPSPATNEARQLSPGAAYTEAMHPLEVTRHNIANWSDTELAALKVTIVDAAIALVGKNFSSSRPPTPATQGVASRP